MHHPHTHNQCSAGTANHLRTRSRRQGKVSDTPHRPEGQEGTRRSLAEGRDTSRCRAGLEGSMAHFQPAARRTDRYMADSHTEGTAVDTPACWATAAGLDATREPDGQTRATCACSSATAERSRWRNEPWRSVGCFLDARHY